MFLSLEILTSIIRTGSLILVELIDLVNSVIIFLSQMTLLRWLTFLLGSQTVILIVLLFWIYFFSGASICSTMAFPPLWNTDHAVASVSIDFPSNSHFHCIAYYYSCADWDGLPDDHLRDVPWEDIFKASVRYFFKFLFFHQMIALQELWKMFFFFSSKKLFSFLR